jgi:hypothetical protein
MINHALKQPARANTHTHTRTHGSNYCGSTGNYGAVVVFQSDLSYTVEEHMAPELSEASARRRGLVRGTGLTRRRGAVREWRGNSEGRVLVRGPWTRIRDSDT